ncbi:hypothetical protein DL98DRAFT_534238 [Cadophora sp. DSE1049]|nr:hypothetical protein DL98DRAFT_534238 [Cadophora sp. DSE1049]
MAEQNKVDNNYDSRRYFDTSDEDTDNNYDPREFFGISDEASNKLTVTEKDIPMKPAVFCADLEKKPQIVNSFDRVQHHIISKNSEQKRKRGDTEAVEDSTTKEHEGVAEEMIVKKGIPKDGGKEERNRKKERQVVADFIVTEERGWSDERQELLSEDRTLRQRLKTLEQDFDQGTRRLKLATKSRRLGRAADNPGKKEF